MFILIYLRQYICSQTVTDRDHFVEAVGEDVFFFFGR